MSPAGYRPHIITQPLAEVSRRAGARVIDPIEILGDAERCPVLDQSGVPIYRDDGHFSVDYSRGNARFLDAALTGSPANPAAN